MHKLVIKPVPGHEDEVSHGRNTQVFLDGQELKTVKSILFSVTADEPTKVRIELYAGVELDANLKDPADVIKESKQIDNKGGSGDGSTEKEEKENDKDFYTG